MEAAHQLNVLQSQAHSPPPHNFSSGPTVPNSHGKKLLCYEATKPVIPSCTLTYNDLFCQHMSSVIIDVFILSFAVMQDKFHKYTKYHSHYSSIYSPLYLQELSLYSILINFFFKMEISSFKAKHLLNTTVLTNTEKVRSLP